MAKKILIVDDEKDVCDAIKTVLESAGFSVDTMYGSLAALEHLKKDANYDLVLIDLFMPDMSGKEFVGNIRANKNLKGLRCALLTAANFSKTENTALEKTYSVECIQKSIES